MDRVEARLRLIEAAAKNPFPHADGFAAGVQETASTWFDWVFSGGEPGNSPSTLHLPKKPVKA